MEKSTEVLCHSCNKPSGFDKNSKIMRNDECSHCYADIHCCKMCDFYDKTAYNECRESNADRIVEKDKANFCDYFVLSGNGGNGQDQKNDLLSAANSLFKD